MPLLTASGLTKYYGTVCLFENATFAIEPRDRIGLIGQNGTGKTTLLRILLGLETTDGTVSHAKDIRIAHLTQDAHLTPGQTVRESVFSAFAELAQLEHDLHAARAALADTHLPESVRAEREQHLIELEHTFDSRGGHGAERRVDTILYGLGIRGAMLDQPVETLSGGERNRVALARLLADEPDLWLLDEPTNHLDLDGIAFLESLLRSSRAAAIIISHDRRFLDDVTTRTWELENETLYTYPAAYTRSRSLRDERFQAGMKSYQAQQRYIDKEQSFVERYHNKRVKEARGRRRRLARLERIERPEQREQAMNLRLPEGRRLGNRVLALQNLTGGYEAESPLFKSLRFEVEPGEVLGIVGANGTGKTTLLRILLGELPPLSGSLAWGKTVVRGVLHQHETFPEHADTPLRFILGTGVPDQMARDALGAMLFRGGEAEAPIRILSGGERKRLMLTRLILEGSNVLLLDEPTNHLDLASREALEGALSVFTGTIVMISHDRHFLDQICDRILWLEPDGWYLTPGGFTEALTAREARLTAAEAKNNPLTASPSRTTGGTPPPNPRPGAKKEKRPLAGVPTEKLEARIISLEEDRAILQERFATPEVYHDPAAVAALQTELDSLASDLLALEEEYATREG